MALGLALSPLEPFVAVAAAATTAIALTLDARRVTGLASIGAVLLLSGAATGDARLRSLDELAEVEGIGEKRLATLRDALQP